MAVEIYGSRPVCWNLSGVGKERKPMVDEPAQNCLFFIYEKLSIIECLEEEVDTQAAQFFFQQRRNQEKERPVVGTGELVDSI